ncbi:MAG TPA: guanylate kinase, partial [Solirubrobacteraceae bacterium]
MIQALRDRVPGLGLSVSATTRAPRPGERDGVAYHFLTRDQFCERVAAGDFVEHADYSGNRYGTLRSELEERLADGIPVLLEIEVQGARQVREQMPEAVQVFIAPPSREALRARLLGRGTDTPAQVDRRLETADD